MVTTALAWVAGVILVWVARSPVQFERALEAVTRSGTSSPPGTRRAREPEHPLVRVCRLLTFLVGVTCIVLGALGTRALLG